MNERLLYPRSVSNAELISNREIIVSKFGGTSVGSEEGIHNLVDIVAKQCEDGNNVIVVVSAQNGVTNQLLEIAKAKEIGNFRKANALAEGILDRYNSSLASLNLHENQFTSAALDLYHISKSLSREIEKGGVSTQDVDRLLSFGEKMSASLISAAVSTQIPSMPVDATKILISDRNFSMATIDIDASFEKSQPLLIHMNTGVVPVVTGFIASTMFGETTTLGRGGSDSSAAALARIFNAGELHIFTDVDGVYSDDPNRNPSAFRYDVLDFHSAQELAHKGAKVIYYNMFSYLKDTNIPVRVRNTFSPDSGGTLIKPYLNYAA